MSDLGFNFVLQRLQVGRGPIAGRFEAGEFCGDLAILESFGDRVHEDLVNTVGGPDRDAGRYSNSLSHVANLAISASDDKRVSVSRGKRKRCCYANLRRVQRPAKLACDGGRR